MENCISDICPKMLMDSPKLNDNKTEFLIIGTLQELEKVDIPFVSMCNSNCPNVAARNFSSWFDSRLSMAKRITKFVPYYFHFSFCTTYDISGNTSLKSQLRLSSLSL